MKIFFTFIFSILFSNAATAGFDEIEIKTTIKANYVLGVMVSDQRETVAKWGAAENLIGAHHSGVFRNRKDLITGTEGPLSNEMVEGLRKQLANNWVSAASMMTTPKDSREVLNEKIHQARLHRTMLVTVKALWVESQHSNQTAMNYNFVVTVLDDKAVELAKKDMEGIQSSAQWGTWGATDIFGMLMSNALEDPKISEALLK
jgi:hypothetical protein